MMGNTNNINRLLCAVKKQLLFAVTNQLVPQSQTNFSCGYKPIFVCGYKLTFVCALRKNPSFCLLLMHSYLQLHTVFSGADAQLSAAESRLSYIAAKAITPWCRHTATVGQPWAAGKRLSLLIHQVDFRF